MTRRYLKFGNRVLGFGTGGLRISLGERFEDRNPVEIPPDEDPEEEPDEEEPEGTPPTCFNDTGQVQESSAPKSFDVLANDLGTRPLTLEIVELTGDGSAQVVAGKILYTPPGAPGFANIIYRATNPFGSANGALGIIVTAAPVVGVAPSAVNDARSVSAGAAPLAIDVLANDTGTAPLDLSTTISLSGVGTAVVINKKIVYTAPAAVGGTAVITYTVTNAVGSDTGTLTINVAAPPAEQPGEERGLDTGLRRIFVRKNGSNNNSGLASNQAKLTIQAACNIAQPGDVISVGDGLYRERITLTNFPGTSARPLWIAAENPGEVRISDLWPEVDAGTQVWTSEGSGVFSAAHERVYTGEHDGDFLLYYRTEANLAAGSITVEGDSIDKPDYGISFANNRVFIKLRGSLNPNGRSIQLTNTFGRSTVTLNNADFVILDGFVIEGAGNSRAVSINQACASPQIRNCEFKYARFGVDCPSNTIVENCHYHYPGIDEWAREIHEANGDNSDGAFALVKRHFTGDIIGSNAGNALLEGSIDRGFAQKSTNVILQRNTIGPCFDGMRLGEHAASVARFNKFKFCLDDGIQLESDTSTGSSGILRVHDNRFTDCFFATSHQSSALIGDHHVFRNVFEGGFDPDVVHPAGFIKCIFTPTTVRLNYYHNLFIMRTALSNEGFGTNKWVWFDFAPNGHAERIIHFRNNIVMFKDKLDNGSGGNPVNVNNNVLVAPAANALFSGTGGLFVGTTEASMNLNADYSLKSNSAARNRAAALPAGLPDSRSSNLDCGPFPFGEAPGLLWPFEEQFDLSLPSRWPFSSSSPPPPAPPPTGGGEEPTGGDELTFMYWN
jgi:hypothetical protein